VRIRFPSAVAAFVALAPCASARAADVPSVGALPDLAGPRTLGLAATVGTASGNEGLFVNPGAISARRRYSVEVGGGIERRGAESVGEVLSGSVVDSITSPVAAGISWSKVLEGVHQGSVVDLAFAGQLAAGLHVGVSGKWLSLDGPRKVRAVTVDAGLFWQLGEWVALGAAGYNLVPVGNEVVAPRTVAAGLSVGTDRFAQVTADWNTNLDADRKRNRYAVGAEVLLARQFPVRAGWVVDEASDTRWWSAGAGVVRGKVGLDVGYRQAVDDASARSIWASFKLYLVD
jgi:hypothetical protein